jgi:hypothetical protein
MDEYPVICMKCGVRGTISGSVLATITDPTCPGCGSTDIDLDDGDRSKLSMRKGAPFAEYSDFADCVAKNQDKDNPEAYCGKIKHQVEGKSDDNKVVPPPNTKEMTPEEKAQNEIQYLIAEEEDIHRQAIVEDILRSNPGLPREAAIKIATRVSTRYLANSKSFDEWMQDVDDAVQAKVGLSIHDLEDQPFTDWYEDGVTAASAARRALQYSGGDF